jgi:hypothetical protein
MKKHKFVKRRKTNTYVILLLLAGLATILLSFYISRQMTLNTKASANVRKIIGGGDASIDSWPNVVLLFDYDKVTKNGSLNSANISQSRICTGSVIDNNWVLTAAHCIDNPSKPNFGIITGFDDFATQRVDFVPGKHIFKPLASDIFINKDYKVIEINKKGGKIMAYADLALIKINKLNTAKLRPIAVATKIDYNSRAVIVGWGLSGFDNLGKPVLSDHLKGLEVKLVKKGAQYFVTDAFYGTKFKDKVLTEYLSPGQSTATGDSGAPLMAFDSKLGKFVQIGVNTSGQAITDLTKYIGWIKKVTGLKF